MIARSGDVQTAQRDRPGDVPERRSQDQHPGKTKRPAGDHIRGVVPEEKHERDTVQRGSTTAPAIARILRSREGRSNSKQSDEARDRHGRVAARERDHGRWTPISGRSISSFRTRERTSAPPIVDAQNTARRIGRAAARTASSPAAKRMPKPDAGLDGGLRERGAAGPCRSSARRRIRPGPRSQGVRPTVADAERQHEHQHAQQSGCEHERERGAGAGGQTAYGAHRGVQQRLGDLDGVECCALAQVVVHGPEREPVRLGSGRGGCGRRAPRRVPPRRWGSASRPGRRGRRRRATRARRPGRQPVLRLDPDCLPVPDEDGHAHARRLERQPREPEDLPRLRRGASTPRRTRRPRKSHCISRSASSGWIPRRRSIPASPAPDIDWYVASRTRAIPTASWRGFSTQLSWIAEQFGLATIRPPSSASSLTPAHDQRNAIGEPERVGLVDARSPPASAVGGTSSALAPRSDGEEAEIELRGRPAPAVSPPRLGQPAIAERDRLPGRARRGERHTRCRSRARLAARRVTVPTAPSSPRRSQP